MNFFFAVCKRTCVSKSALDKHFLIHTQDKPFECIHCHKHFKQKSHVNYHVKMVHGTLPKDRPRNHICFHCGSAFTTASTLKKHVKTHTLGNFTNFSIQEKVDFTTFLSYLFSILCNFTNFSFQKNPTYANIVENVSFRKFTCKHIYYVTLEIGHG